VNDGNISDWEDERGVGGENSFSRKISRDGNFLFMI
jgi:hypothetical protein